MVLDNRWGADCVLGCDRIQASKRYRLGFWAFLSWFIMPENQAKPY
ncbi:hypothetical protein [Coleofasciculus sp. FACHB-SPT9]|nr:hypothetical protein [Coleofasciculus sp. FACHB-SPT9]